MKIHIRTTSGGLSEYENTLKKYKFENNQIEILSLEELTELSLELGWDIIVSNKFKDEEPFLEIYDDYRE